MDEKQIDEAINKTLEYCNYCKKSEWIKSPAIGLKGMVGELIALKFLKKHFGDSVEYRGGRTKGYDIKIGKLKIEVKTSHQDWDKNSKREFIDYEISQDTISPKTFTETDFIIWVVLYLSDDFQIERYSLYIFDSKKEGSYFHNTGWHRNNPERLQIIRIKSILKEFPKTMKAMGELRWMQEMNQIYNTPQYRDLFLHAETDNGVKKIKDRLNNQSHSQP